jgi:hypothetical protein
MRRLLPALTACSLVLGCSGLKTDENEPLGTTEEALNGTLASRGNLTRKSFLQPDEAQRQADTNAYYASVHIGANGSSGQSISAGIPTLAQFKSVYGFAANDPSAVYYNRGDLGLGREMHCADRSTVSGNGQIACYVVNYAGGYDNTEFAFGLSANIAFDNMAKQPPNVFATVAMVFRNLAPAKDKVFFVVYDGNGNLQPFAALDRHGFNYALAFKQGPPGPEFGTPGENFNNHVPTNCAACHSGRYDTSLHAHTGALFLPFDLDQFEYQNAAGKTRNDQLTSFQHLNEMARKVAALTGTAGGTSIKKQLDGVYHNTPTLPDVNEVFETNNYDSSFVPSITDAQGGGTWNHDGVTAAAYTKVVRRSCRACHVSDDAFSFDTESQFRSLALTAASDICNFQMPHSLQTLREFWQSTAPAALESYYRSVGQSVAADRLHGCGPGTVSTLDPHLIGSAASPLF